MNSNHNSGYKILVVDDDKVNISIFREILEDRYILQSVRSGSDALGLLPQFRPDLILLDVMMPGLTGYQVCEKIRANPHYRFVKIILVSGRANLEDRLEGYKAGADDYLTKPFNEDELIAKVEVFLRLHYAEKYEQINRQVLDQFSSDSSRPLARILSATDMLASCAPLTEDQLECVHIINKEGEKLLRTVEQSRQYCELKKGVKLLKSSEPLKLNLDSLRSNFYAELQDRSLQIEIEINKELEIEGDWTRLTTAFKYLLASAIELSADGAMIIVHTTTTEGAFGLTIQAAGNLLSTFETGRLFDVFSSPAAATKITLKRAIAQAIIELHGGQVCAENREGTGVAFRISLPQDMVNNLNVPRK